MSGPSQDQLGLGQPLACLLATGRPRSKQKAALGESLVDMLSDVSSILTAFTKTVPNLITIWYCFFFDTGVLQDLKTKHYQMNLYLYIDTAPTIFSLIKT